MIDRLQLTSIVWQILEWNAVWVAKIKQINRSEALRVEIADAITAVEDDDEKTVLRKMYLSDARPSMEDIGRAMYISRSSAWRLLNKAIDNFKIPLAMAPSDKSFLFSEVETV